MNQRNQRARITTETEGLRKKNVSDQTPDLAMEDTRRIEIERETEIRIQPNQQINQRGEADHDSDSPGMREKTKTAFEFIQQGHVCG